ncbi:MAG TPA: undecaprenyldiphospho-muramoylpentapeptide beta-N-acetylglucosaminyltransferase [Hyphomicrobiaceae bacterium]|nr:undecaprenyldiphospho-muramoylpentapeptide beta-N-acetylglucosaminyltransferase [Hyphomicrobiaceae bacterium]
MPVSVMLAAGGTGGHLFPAFALAQELGRRRIAVDLVTDMRADRYDSGFPARAVYRVPSASVAGQSVAGVGRAAISLSRGVAASLKLLRAVKPSAVVGFGGYPAFPPLVAARLIGVPTALHEQNAVLGRANRSLARFVTAIAASFEETKFLTGPRLGKVRVTGNPVRDQVVDWATQSYRPPRQGGPYSLLVFGGSQGARFFSDAIPEALALAPDWMRERLFVVQQCREEDLERVEHAYQLAGIRAHLAAFFTNLPEEMAKAHLVIGRSGASTGAELTVMGRPAILVPLPHAVDNDQLQNALRLSDAGAAWCLEQKNFTAEFLAKAVTDLLTNPDELAHAAAAAKAQGRPDAVTRLADLVEELVGRKARNA